MAPPRDDFDERLAAARAQQHKDAPAKRSKASANAMGYGFRVATELVGGVLVGAGIGWGLDRLLGTSPWLLIVFLMLGFGAGINNVLRATKKLDRELAGKDPGESDR